MFSYHNNQIGTDVPLHIRFFDAKRHDSVSALVCLAEFRKLHPDLSIKNICLDSANDNYATYQLLQDWNIFPFIDLNTNSGRSSSIPDNIQIDTDGTPLCQAGYRMVNWGMCPQNTHENGVVLLPAAKKKHATANPTAPPQPTGVVFILNPSGICACIRQSHVVRKHIKRYITTAQVQSV